MPVPRPTLVPPPQSEADESWLEDDNAVDYSAERFASLPSDDDSSVNNVRKAPVKRRRSRHYKLPIFKFPYRRKKA